MSLLAPWALWLSPIGLAVVTLYLLKIKRRRQTVPSLEFWRNLAGQTQMRSLFQRLKRWLSMMLWLLIVACLVFSAGNPVLSLGGLKPQSIAVVIDNSASMQAVEADRGGRTRLQMAFDALHQLLDGRPHNDEWMLIEAARDPVVLQGWTRNRMVVRSAAESIRPFAGSADPGTAVALADQLLEGKSNPRIVVISDGAAGRAMELAAERKHLTWWPLGSTRDNLGITAFRVRTHRQQSNHHAYVRLVSASDREVETQLILELNGSAVAVEPVKVAAGGEWDRTVVVDAPQGGILTARIDRPDTLALDNEAYAILAPVRPVKVLLVTPPQDAFFFEQALRAMEVLVDAESSQTITPEEYRAMATPPNWADLMIFNNCRPAMPAAGRFVFVNDWPSGLPAKTLGTLETPRLFIASTEHPLTRYLNVSGATVARARRVDYLGRGPVLAQSADGSPLIFLDEQPALAAVCLAFDVLESDLPFRNAFPVFLRNVVLYLAAEPSPWIQDQYRPGDVIEPGRPINPSLTEVTVAALRGAEVREERVPVSGGSFSFDRTSEPGPLRITIGEETAYTAVNLADVAESRLSVPPREGDAGRELGLTSRFMGAVPWVVLAILATTLVGVEWLSYHLRWTE
ncbi:MAG: VWA domain-containing protein [Planctomycetes bacterium]|nr:VWA domain-containing protein [Planctomycetota bacterium]